MPGKVHTITLPVDAATCTFAGQYVIGTVNGVETALANHEVRELLSLVERRK